MPVWEIFTQGNPALTTGNVSLRTVGGSILNAQEQRQRQRPWPVRRHRRQRRHHRPLHPRPEHRLGPRPTLRVHVPQLRRRADHVQPRHLGRRHLRPRARRRPATTSRSRPASGIYLTETDALPAPGPGPRDRRRHPADRPRSGRHHGQRATQTNDLYLIHSGSARFAESDDPAAERRRPRRPAQHPQGPDLRRDRQRHPPGRRRRDARTRTARSSPTAASTSSATSR